MIGKASVYFKAINSIDGSDVRVSKRGQVPYNRSEVLKEAKLDQQITKIISEVIMLVP